jgi:hypothetical protein
MIKTPLKLFADCIVEKGITALSLRHFYPHLFETARILGV